jgi:hypothetical protein
LRILSEPKRTGSEKPSEKKSGDSYQQVAGQYAQMRGHANEAGNDRPDAICASAPNA